MPESRININNLSPYQLAIQGAVGKGKGADKRLTADMLGRIADQVFGAAPVTPGSQIIYQDAVTVRWRDSDGYEHTAMRSLDGRDPNAGRWNIQTNRPAILPDKGAQQLSATLTPGVVNDLEAVRALSAQLQQPATLLNLDPETKAALQQITDNTLAQLQQQFERDQAARVAELFGNRIQQSSIAGNVLGQLLQQQGLVRSQALSDAATRELGTRQYITDTQRARQQLALQGLLGSAGTGSNLLQNLTGQQTQRDIASGGINLDYAKLGEAARQFGLNYELAQQDADLRLAAARKGSDVFGNALQGIAGSLINFGLGQIPGLSSIGGGGGSGQIYGAGSQWPQN